MARPKKQRPEEYQGDAFKEPIGDKWTSLSRPQNPFLATADQQSKPSEVLPDESPKLTYQDHKDSKKSRKKQSDSLTAFEVLANDKTILDAIDEKPYEKVLCKAFHMVIGVDLIGSKTSLSSSRNMELEVTPIGIKAHSKNSGRTVLIPWTNIKGAELFT